MYITLHPAPGDPATVEVFDGGSLIGVFRYEQADGAWMIQTRIGHVRRDFATPGRALDALLDLDQ
jgi:hypothetical protein